LIANDPTMSRAKDGCRAEVRIPFIGRATPEKQDRRGSLGNTRDRPRRIQTDRLEIWSDDSKTRYRGSSDGSGRMWPILEMASALGDPIRSMHPRRH
jgi:hypothetical protein